MSSKKGFYTENPAEAFFQNSVEKQKKSPVKEETTQTVGELDQSELLVKAERKSVRLNLLLTPSLKEKLRAESDRTGISINDIINQVLTNYFK